MSTAALRRPAFTPVDMYYDRFGSTWPSDTTMAEDFKTRTWWEREVFLFRCNNAVKEDEIVDAYGVIDALETVHLNAGIK